MPGAKKQEETDDKNKNKNKNGGEGDDPGADDPSDDGTGGQGDDDGAGGEDFSDPEKAKAEIKRLRDENAKSRIKNKKFETELSAQKGVVGKLKAALGIEDDAADPETQIKDLKSQNENLVVQAAMNDLCDEHDIPSASKKYFKFLVSEEFAKLKDDEEISDERVAEIAAEAKKVGGSGGKNPNSSTGVDGNAGGGKKPAGKDDALDVAQFVKMNLGEKSALYTKNPSLYQKLMDEAKEKRLL